MPAAFGDIRDFLVRHNVPQVVDFDDNVFEIDRFNPSKSGVFVDEVKEWMRAVGDITVTRKSLADYYLKEVPMIAATVLPNYVDFEKVPETVYKPCRNRPFRLGWMGGRSHYRDLLLIKPVLQKLQKRYGDKLQLVLFGWDGRLVNSHGLPPVFEGLEITHRDPVGRSQYEQTILELAFDAVFIPLEDTIFNRSGKSPVKWLEASSLRIPTVVSNIPVYTEVVVPERTALTATTVEEWDQQLSRLIENPDLCQHISDEAYEDVHRHWDIATHIGDRAAYYRKLALRKYQLESIPVAAILSPKIASVGGDK
jgi:glycosyltransferase involved in cell wall biosynthesis